MKRNSSAAFTLIEMLVVISIIAVLAAFAVPALTSALTRGQMTGTVNNTHQLYLAAQQMALDGTTNSDSSLGWPGDITTPAAVTTLLAYCDKLVANNYLPSAGDLKKVLSAPGTTCAVTGGTTAADGTYSPITAIGTPALKIYRVHETNPPSTVFAVTANYTYNTALTPAGSPFGDKGFVVQRKGGDASIFKKAQATGSGTAFQSLVGRIPGDTDGTAGTESTSGAGQNVLN
jgi:prepilin-type N-terminal cleavage/methylation domain-containing protein